MLKKKQKNIYCSENVSVHLVLLLCMYRFLDLVDNCRCANHRFPPFTWFLPHRFPSFYLIPACSETKRLPDDYLIYLILAYSETTRLPDYLITWLPDDYLIYLILACSETTRSRTTSQVLIGSPISFEKIIHQYLIACISLKMKIAN